MTFRRTALQNVGGSGKGGNFDQSTDARQRGGRWFGCGSTLTRWEGSSDPSRNVFGGSQKARNEMGRVEKEGSSHSSKLKRSDNVGGERRQKRWEDGEREVEEQDKLDHRSCFSGRSFSM